MERKNRPSALGAAALSSSSRATQPRVEIVGDDRVVAALPSGESVEVLLTGATVTRWTAPGGQERLWLSDGAILDGSKAVRGGIPLVFPVFGTAPAATAAGKLPQHGLARTSRWDFLGKSTTEAETPTSASAAGPSQAAAAASRVSAAPLAGTGVQLDFGLSAATADAKLAALWPGHDFSLVYRVTLEPGRLTTNIVITNEGASPFDFQVLLHTYLRVGDIGKVEVTGLGGSPYVDKVGADAPAQRTEKAGGTITITGETDRVYSPEAGAAAPVAVVEAGQPRFSVSRDNLADVVVWNPWTAKAAGMADFAPKDGFRQMLCIEPGAVSGWTTLEPGDAYEGAQTITAH